MSTAAGACSYDTALTAAGEEQAKAAAKHSKHLRPAPQLIIASPLSRALHTADLCLPPAAYPDAPRMAHPLARERLYLSSDVGLTR
jgi:broad specificity phosphatase PhoE